MQAKTASDKNMKIKIQNQSKCETTFNTQLKTALTHFDCL